VPTISGTRIVRGSITRPDEGRSTPIATKSALMPGASAIPSSSPSAEPTTPSSTPSLSTLESTCRRDAPIALSRPSSRVRCATVIENELKMMNAPTNSDTNPKISRNVLRKLRLPATSSDCERASSAPVRTFRVRAGSSRFSDATS